MKTPAWSRVLVIPYIAGVGCLLGICVSCLSLPAAAASLSRVGVWPEMPRLSPYGVYVEGNHLWVALADGVAVLDVTRPGEPQLLGRITFPAGDGAFNLCAAEGRVYTSNGTKTMYILDATDPANLTILGHFTPRAFVNSLFARSGHLYTSHNKWGLGLSLVSNPGSPVFGYLDATVPASGPALAVDQRLYVPTLSGLKILRLTTPTDLALLGEYNAGVRVADVRVVDGLAYMAASNGLQVLQVSDPAHVARVGLLGTPKEATGVRVFGSVALLTSGTALRVIRVTDPAQPLEIGTYTASARILAMDATQISSMGTTNTYAFLVAAGMDYSLEILRCDPPESPQLALRLVGGALTSQVRLSGTRAYLAEGSAGMQILDVQSPTKPVPLGAFTLLTGARAVDGGATLACVGGWGEVAVIDVTDPAHPARRGGANLMGEVNQLRLVGDRVYVLSGSGGLTEFRVFALANPDLPKPLGHYTVGTDAWSFEATPAGHVAIASGARGLDILDARNLDPVNPGLIPRAVLYVAQGQSAVHGVDLQPGAGGFRGFLATAQGLEIVDFQAPSTATRVGGWSSEGVQAMMVASADRRVYLANATHLWSIDVSVPAQPVLEAEATGAFGDLAATSDYLFAASGALGVTVWRVDAGPANAVLHCTAAPGGVRLDWAAAGAGWTLQSTLDLNNLSGWQPVAGSEALTSLDQPTNAPARFYRLTRP